MTAPSPSPSRAPLPFLLATTTGVMIPSPERGLEVRKIFAGKAEWKLDDWKQELKRCLREMQGTYSREFCKVIEKWINGLHATRPGPKDAWIFQPRQPSVWRINKSFHHAFRGYNAKRRSTSSAYKTIRVNLAELLLLRQLMCHGGPLGTRTRPHPETQSWKIVQLIRNSNRPDLAEAAHTSDIPEFQPYLRNATVPLPRLMRDHRDIFMDVPWTSTSTALPRPDASSVPGPDPDGQTIPRRSERISPPRLDNNEENTDRAPPSRLAAPELSKPISNTMHRAKRWNDGTIKR